jgi:hypothetical protein
MELESFIAASALQNRHPFSFWPEVEEGDFARYLCKEISKLSFDPFISQLPSGDEIRAYPIRLDWDSDFFGYPCHKIVFVGLAGEPLESKGAELATQRAKLEKWFENFLESTQAEFVFADIPSLDSNSNFLLQEIGFRYVLTWVNGFMNTSGLDLESRGLQKLRFGEISARDYDQAISLIRKSYFKGGRFFLDHGFLNRGADVNNLYSCLIENAARDGQRLRGIFENEKLISLFLVTQPKRIATTDFSSLRLFATDQDFRGRGLAQMGLKECLNEIKSTVKIFNSGLEVHNIESLNFHRSFGFKYNFLHNAYHFWRKKL